jgi:hypothetical protein
VRFHSCRNGLLFRATDYEYVTSSVTTFCTPS